MASGWRWKTANTWSASMQPPISCSATTASCRAMRRFRIDGGEAKVEAIGGDVAVGNTEVAIGHGCRARMPVMISIGDASLRLSPGSAARRPLGGLASAAERMANHPAKLAGAVIVCALAVVAASHGMQKQPVQVPLADTARLDPSPPEDHDAARPGAAGSASSIAQTASEELALKLKEAGIGTIRTSASDGRVVADGRLSEKEAAGWSSIQRWFDTKYAASTPLIANVAIGPLAGPAPVRLQAVWFGERPYIIADNGSHYYEGAVLESGWTIQRIGEDRVVLSRDTETLALTYR